MSGPKTSRYKLTPAQRRMLIAQVRRGFGVSCEYTHETLQTETISRR